MEILQQLYTQLQNWFADFATISSGLQLGAVLVSASLAYLTHHHWQNFITRLLGGFEKQGFFRALLRGTDRAAFPMSMLIYILIFRGLLGTFNLGVAVLDVFTPLLLSLAGIRLIVFALRRGFAQSPALTAWEGVISLSVWGVVALHLVGWLPGLINAMDELAISFGESRISVLAVIKFVIAIVIFVVAANWLSRLIERRARKSPHISASMRVGLSKTSKFLLYTLAIIFALNSVGIDLTTFAVFSGALGVGLGFGLQRIASNFISGFILLFDRSIRPGDVISIGTRFGWVRQLSARYIVVRDRDGVETLIPNENLITSEVTNWSYSDRQVRVKLPVQISYNDDPENAMAIMLEASKANERVLQNPEPVTRLMGFGDNGIELELRLWIRDPENGIGNVKSDVNLAIWRGFKEHHITIPFPQRDVHLLEAE